MQNGSSELLRWREAIEQRLQMQPMRDYGGEPVYSVVCMSPTRAQLDKAMAECSEFDFVLMDDRQHDIVNAETANRRYNKGSGIKQVCAAIGVDPADSICFGDSLNDLPMFAAAGFSVCMGNGGGGGKAIRGRGLQFGGGGRAGEGVRGFRLAGISGASPAYPQPNQPSGEGDECANAPAASGNGSSARVSAR